MSLPIEAIVTDIEGTTTPIAFVHDTLFPFAAAHLEDFLAREGADPAVAAILGDVRALAPDVAPVVALRDWMARDAKITPLKTLQGLIWERGYASGALTATLYPDVAPALRAWTAAGRRLAVYSSGSIAAQRLLFGHTAAGDLTGLFAGWFDTTTGPKRAAASYRAIADAMALPASAILFLSDVTAELDAAAEAGLRTCQLVRAEDGTHAGATHQVAADFAGVAATFGLECTA